jgi:hypothetical protein
MYHAPVLEVQSWSILKAPYSEHWEYFIFSGVFCAIISSGIDIVYETSPYM